ncbi:bifunctional UDP-sugar hydrolase/5'-nucleotidase [uncultured Paracoccus sp.]|uniref:bifunctional metallophosphatase/5'-nucleotidase n=1 Tax=uncultured Paracoccus sp. TaxID=189685 RepID=UPI00261295B0|nr:bifunctional UDP-sugar hydrolase/5'-nucleotidase [uncultured Paracoccus sp.]
MSRTPLDDATASIRAGLRSDASRRAFLTGAAAVLAGPAVARSGTPAAGTVTILHTNDFHGRHSAFEVAPGNALAQTGQSSEFDFPRAGSIGGMPRLARAVRDRREALGSGNVLLVDGGDSFSDDLLGNLTRGEAMIRLMNAVGYDFMALGNHDFDYGLDRTRELANIAKFPIRGANVRDEASGQPLLGDPALVREIGGISVGLLAVGYHNTPLTTNADNIRGLRFTNGIEEARRLVPDLRRRADLVVVVSHQGSAVDRKMLHEVDGIDLVIAAHSHDLISPPERIGNGWLVQALSDGTMLGEVTLSLQGGTVASVEGAVHTLWADEVEEDTEVAALLEELRAPHEEVLQERIADAAERIGRSYEVESPFDKLIGRILREETGAEIALLPGVGYGVALTSGPITAEALRRLLPHEARIATVTLTGEQLHAVLEQSASNLAPDDPIEKVGGLIQTDGLTWTADLRRPIGERVSAVSVGGSSLEPGRRYAVVANAGMLNGLHRYDVVGQGQKIQRLEQGVYDLVEAAFRRGGRVEAPALGDVTVVQRA